MSVCQNIVELFSLLLILLCKSSQCNRIVCVGYIQRNNSAPVVSSLNRRLLHIHINILRCLHNTVKSVLNRHRSKLLAVPYINEGIILNSVCHHNLLPSCNLLVVFLCNLVHSGYKIGVQLTLVCISHLLHKCLTIRTSLPVKVVYFISSHIDYFAWEKFCNIFNNLLYKLVVALLCNAPYFSAVTGVVNACIFRSVAENLRITCCNCKRMSRSFNLRNNLYSQRLRITYNIFNLLLSVKTSVALIA